MNNTHTHGPWKVLGHETHPAAFLVMAESREIVATVPDQKPNVAANARLIAAAPELLEACRLMLEAECRNGYGAALRERDPETLDEHHAVYLNALAAIGKAIAKAEGRA